MIDPWVLAVIACGVPIICIGFIAYYSPLGDEDFNVNVIIMLVGIMSLLLVIALSLLNIQLRLGELILEIN